MLFNHFCFTETTHLNFFSFIFLLNKVVLLQRFRFYFVFCVFVVLSTFGLLSVYRSGVVRHLVTTFYLCRGDSDKQDRFDL